MSQQKFVANIKGLFPLLDRRKISEPYVVEGQNFLMDQDGPFSGLGRTLLSYRAISFKGNIQTFKISETSESLILNNEGVFRFDTLTGKTVVLYLFFPFIISEFPWSFAGVGNKYYFARKDSPLIEYDILADAWTSLSGGSIPDNIHSCTESDGRLHVLTDRWLSWSAIGDGRDFQPSIITGAGAQALTKLGLTNPRPLGLKTVPDGVLTFLSSGIMKSQSIVATNPYRHTILSKRYVPINPYCITNDEDDSVLFLTKVGFYRTNGQSPESWEPAMGEHFHTKIIPTLDVINNQNNIQIHFNTERSWFTVWLSATQQPFNYNKAFIFNSKIAQWGSLDASFTCLTDFFTLPSQFAGFFFGLVDLEGSIYRFNEASGVEIVPDLINGLSYWHEISEESSRVNDSTLIATIRGNFTTETKRFKKQTGVYDKFSPIQQFLSPQDFIADEKLSTSIAGVVTFSLNTTMAVGVVELRERRMQASFESLNSYVHIGLFRLYNEMDNDRYSYLTNIAVGTLGSAVGSTFEDWNSPIQYPVTLFEDWGNQVAETFEDWGDGGISSVTGSVDYDLKLIATLDGYSPIENYETRNSIVENKSFTDFYSCDSSGVYHIIEIAAFSLGKNFHVKTLDISGNIGGRL